MIRHVAILAGGLATRLYPVTKTMPKSLIEVAGKPFIHHQLSLFKTRGITDVVLCVGYLGEMVEEYVGTGEKWGLNVKYSHDGDVLLGTGGSLKKATSMLPDSFFVMYGDSYLDAEYKPISDSFEYQKKPALMAVFHNRNQFDTSNIIFKDGKILKYDKVNKTPDMEYVDYGMAAVQKTVFDEWPEGKFDLASVYQKLLERGQLAGFEVKTRFYEGGSVSGLKETDQYLSRKQP